ncbi:MAG TPA: sigma 54-interacting transcriptional regulator [Thermoanaerobaculia bacterium]
MTDLRRLSVLLQAAGLLSLLDRAGWRAVDWGSARLSPDGRLTLVAGVEPEREPRPAQEVLRDLLIGLFSRYGERGPLGRGEGKRVARSLLELWEQSLTPLSPDDALAQILDAVPVLWKAEYGRARMAMAGEMLLADGGGRRARLWIAGPPSFRRAVLARCGRLEDARTLLAGPQARALWDCEQEGRPEELAASGRWRAAVAAWTRRPPKSEEEKVEQARALAALGRFEAALRALIGLTSTAACLARIDCQAQTGQLFAARRTLQQLTRVPLPPGQTVELAETAARVLANSGSPGRADPWIDRALAAADADGGTRVVLRARLAAALAAWDRSDLAAMDRWLEESRAALDDPEIAWRWDHARALRLLNESDPGCARHAALALRKGRRRLPRHQAAGLWNELGVARAVADDLAGAERAFVHALRLFAGCDGPRRTTLALHNLAEIRLRRGRIAGVREILERSASENRTAGNLRGLTQDMELWARFELVTGRPEAALALCRDALRELDRRGLGWRRAELHLLAARALGWMSRPVEAAVELARTSPATLRELEPEERPAVWMQAGDRERALHEAGEIADSGLRDLWQAVLCGGQAPAPLWKAIARLEPYRAARLVFDADRIAPGCAPSEEILRAIGTFRHLGAAAFAGLLESRDPGPWRSLVPLLWLIARDPSGPPEASSAAGPAPAREERPAGAPEIVGTSPALLAALERIELLAPGDLPILILGESGTGKELAARRVHRASARAGRPFLAVNCAALSETLILSELFGHVRGAFTGADQSRLGVFQSAEGGTVFLDEIGDLPLVAQGMLLRVLQEGEVRRLGESAPRKVDVRAVAATHRDLAAMVEAGTFRRDLYYRLRVGWIELPPLRERGEDVLLLADRVLSRLRNPRGSRLSREARACLLAHRWPGNVRELQNVLGVAAALAENGVIGPEHLDLPIAERPAGASYHHRVDAFRRELLIEELAACGGDRNETARRLGLTRQGLSYLMRQLGLG